VSQTASLGIRPAASRPAATYLRGSALLSGGQLLGRALTFVAVTYLARVLGVEMFGAVGFAGAVASYFLLSIDAGLDYVGMRAVAQDKPAVGDIASAVIGARLAICLVVGPLLWLTARWLAASPAGTSLILAYGLTLVSFALNLRWGFQALEQHGRVATVLVLSQASYLAGILVFVHGPGDAVMVPILLFASELVGALLLVAEYRRQGLRLRFPPSFGLASKLLRAAFPLGVARWVRTLQLNSDLMLLAYLAPASVVGVYVAVSRITLLLRELIDMVFLPLFPGLSRSASRDARAFAGLTRDGVRYAALIFLPITIGGCLTAGDVVSLVFGPKYTAGAPALAITLVAVLFVALAQPYRVALIACGRQASVLRITAAGTALNIVLNVVLIPRYSMIGAALSVVASEAVILVLAVVSLSHTVAVSPWRPVFPPAVAAAGMAAVVWFLPAGHFALTAAVAAVTYGGLAVLVRAVRPAEVVEALEWKSR
jgi:O-antigen/teichoic acid export membrane protein